jgi:hypothetical protein
VVIVVRRRRQGGGGRSCCASERMDASTPFIPSLLLAATGLQGFSGGGRKIEGRKRTTTNVVARGS